MDLTCVIINYNNAIYLSQAIESVLAQTQQPNEILISDDGSKDASREIIQRFADAHPHIKPIYREKNLGAAGNRDAAVRAASSTYVAILDSDDWFTAPKLENEFRAIAGQLDAIVLSDLAVVDAKGAMIDQISTSEFCNLSPKQQLRWLVARKRGGPGQSLVFPRQLFIDLGGLNSKQTLYEDWDFKIRATQSKVRWLHSGVTGYNYRRAGTGLSSAGAMKHAKFKLMTLWRNFITSPWKTTFALAAIELVIVKSIKHASPNKRKTGFN